MTPIDNIEQFNNNNEKINNAISDKGINFIDVNGYIKNENYVYGKYLENNDANIIIENSDTDNKVCCQNHDHDNYKCKYGPTNFPHPNTMNGVDRKIFKSYYQANMTLQDYINWLFLLRMMNLLYRMNTINLIMS